MKKLTRQLIAGAATLALFFFASCVSTSGDSQTQISSSIITGSYNTNTSTCDFTSEKLFDSDGNVLGCTFSQKCTGDVRVTDFIPFNDPEFNAKCVNPVEELPAVEDAPSPVEPPAENVPTL